MQFTHNFTTGECKSLNKRVKKVNKISQQSARETRERPNSYTIFVVPCWWEVVPVGKLLERLGVRLCLALNELIAFRVTPSSLPPSLPLSPGWQYLVVRGKQRRTEYKTHSKGDSTVPPGRHASTHNTRYFVLLKCRVPLCVRQYVGRGQTSEGHSR